MMIHVEKITPMVKLNLRLQLQMKLKILNLTGKLEKNDTYLQKRDKKLQMIKLQLQITD